MKINWKAVDYFLLQYTPVVIALLFILILALRGFTD